MAKGFRLIKQLALCVGVYLCLLYGIRDLDLIPEIETRATLFLITCAVFVWWLLQGCKLSFSFFIILVYWAFTSWMYNYGKYSLGTYCLLLIVACSIRIDQNQYPSKISRLKMWDYSSILAMIVLLSLVPWAIWGGDYPMVSFAVWISFCLGAEGKKQAPTLEVFRIPLLVFIFSYGLLLLVARHEYLYFFAQDNSQAAQPAFIFSCFLLGLCFSLASLLRLWERQGIIEVLSFICAIISWFLTFRYLHFPDLSMASGSLSIFVLAGIFTVLGYSINFDSTVDSQPVMITNKWDTACARIGKFGLGIGCLLLTEVLLSSAYYLSKGPRITYFTNEERLPYYVLRDLIVAEDVLFFQHAGIDFARLKWATRDAIKTAELGRGASTISMQLAKLQYLSFDKTIHRKLQQFVIGVYLEATRDKSYILKEYLNVVSFGQGLIGIESASRRYFGKSACALNRTEALQLVLTIEDPARYNPSMRDGFEVVQKRALHVRRHVSVFQSLMMEGVASMNTCGGQI